jgi:hypothetical protein
MEIVVSTRPYPPTLSPPDRDALIAKVGDRFADVIGACVQDVMAELLADHPLTPPQAGEIMNLAIERWSENRSRLSDIAAGRA